MKQVYTIFNEIFLRTPAFPYEAYESGQYYNSVLFKEAVHYASPSFYDQICSIGNWDTIDVDKIKKTLYKYYSRACTRCTPFGLFATCSIGNIATNDNITLSPINKVQKKYKLDTRCIYQIVQYLEKKISVRSKLLYYPNQSFYKVFNNLRYYETTQNDGIQIVSVEKTNYLSRVLKYVRNGKRLTDIISNLHIEEVSQDEVLNYIEMLIENNVLVSELSLAENNNYWFDNIVSFLEKIGETDPILTQIGDLLTRSTNNAEDIYVDIEKLLHSIGVDLPDKCYLQVDCFRPTVVSAINRKTANNILDCIHFLCRLTRTTENSSLERFKIKFEKIYDTKEMPLIQVLDSDLGVNYFENSLSENGLIKNLKFPFRVQSPIMELTPLKKQLFNEYFNAIKSGKREIDLNQMKLSSMFQLTENEFPCTMPVMTSIFQEEGEVKIFIKSMGFSSASAMLGRFYHLNDNIFNIIRKIIKKEEQRKNPSVISAEIVYMPNSKAGNILGKPSLRDYEICIFAKGEYLRNKQIPLSDLTIQLVDGKFILRSKKLGKEILPSLASAYNYHNCDNPILKFLCDLQMQFISIPNLIYWDEIYSEMDYLPRITYKNCIISRQKWRIREEEISTFSRKGSLVTQLRNWKKQRELPDKAVFLEYDNELIIDFNNEISMSIMLDLLKMKKVITVEEFLFGKGRIVSDDENTYCNELIFLLCKNENYL